MTEKHLKNSPMFYYISSNDKPNTIVFIHAVFADHTQFDDQTSFFKENYNVITVDLIGHGKSLNTQKGDSIEKTAEWLSQILKNENIVKAYLVGVSIGTLLIQDFAIKYSDMVVSLGCFGAYDINNFDSKKQKENSATQVLMMVKAIFSIKWFAKSNKMVCAYTEKAQDKFYNMNTKFRRKSFMYLAGLNNLINKDRTVFRSYPVIIGCGDNDIPMAIALATE